jgi:opacity protein-like surface antigen
MKNLMTRASVLLLLIFAVPGMAQTIVIKPYYGYLLPRLSQVNDQISRQIEVWRELLGEPILSPGKIDGNHIWGGQVLYHFNNDYAVTLEASRYQEKVVTDYFRPAASAAERFLFEREVKTFNFAVNLNYYFDYDEASRLNKYVSFGVGLLFAEANSVTFSSIVIDSKTGAVLPLVDTRGDFSGNSVTAALAGGLDLRVAGSISLWGEAGFQYAKIGQLEGTARRLNDQQAAAFTTSTSFDFSGFYFRAGLGIGLPF